MLLKTTLFKYIAKCLKMLLFNSFCLVSFLTHYSPVFAFYTPWKEQKNLDLLVFSGGIKREHQAVMA